MQVNKQLTFLQPREPSLSTNMKTKDMESKAITFLIEFIVPIFILMVLMNKANISLGSNLSLVISFTYALFVSALKMWLIGRAKSWFEANDRLMDFYLGSAVNYCFLAAGVFTVITYFAA